MVEAVGETEVAEFQTGVGPFRFYVSDLEAMHNIDVGVKQVACIHDRVILHRILTTPNKITKARSTVKKKATKSIGVGPYRALMVVGLSMYGMVGIKKPF